MENHLLTEAQKLWDSNEAFEAGKIIFVNLPIETQPIWAARILCLVRAQSGVNHTGIDLAISTAKSPDKWKKGHQVFSKIRASVLVLDEKERKYGLSEDERTLSCVLALSELVAKVTYNATQPLDEFDEDSGWWIVASLKGFVNVWNDAEFSASAWLTATEELRGS